MQPEELVENLCEALMEEDISTARNLVSQLRDWMDDGGFVPRLTCGQFRTLLAYMELR